ncbi:hypothetical protein AWL63_19085 [Sphingomonas panacis]|uniref:Terminase n=2 Tax=Sphingomonas panacis TaxID=1560345 RepID=A0A1B3ZE97_9SPHN|nr:hypothetical protein AWL63_19085 [Sphingomonas panacis]
MPSGGSRPGAGRKRKDPTRALTAAERAKLPATPASCMVPPLHLSDLAQLLFRETSAILEHQGRADPSFIQLVAILAQRQEQIQRWQAVLEVVGDTCESTTVRKVDGQQVITTMIRARPEVAMLSDAMRQAQSLLGELGLTPSAFLRLTGGKKDDPGSGDEFDF